MPQSPFATAVTPDWEGLIQCVERRGEPARVHHLELFLDPEIQDALCRRYALLEGLSPADPAFAWQRQVRLQSFLGYDTVYGEIDGAQWSYRTLNAEDRAGENKRAGGRDFVAEDRGPITSWEEFERYPWPDPARFDARGLEWYEKHLPEGMCVALNAGAHFMENLSLLLGYQELCFALFERRDLLRAICERTQAICLAKLALALEFPRVRVLWGSDDMGFKTGTLISPADLRELVLPYHKRVAAAVHAAGRPYVLHACGQLDAIYDELIDDVKIDAKHSFEDAILPVTEAKRRLGGRVALVGGIDLDFLCRADEARIRERVRRTLEVCLPGGGYLLGSGNTIANYVPLDHYLAMLDEGRKFMA